MAVLQRSDNSEYGDLASWLADERGDRLISGVGAVRPGDTVVYVDPPTAISESVLYDLYALSQANEIDGVGVVTGRTPAEASALARRDDDGGSEHGIVIRGKNKSATCDDPAATVLARDDVTVDRIAELHSGDLASLSMRVKARDVHAYLDEGMICGVPSDPDAFEFDGNQPACVTDGRRDCIYADDVLDADRITVPHVFVCGCSSPLTNNHFGRPVNLGLSLLSGATSLIAPFRPIPVHQYHVALHYALVRAGYPAAERVFLLNRTSEQAGFGSCQYALFGRPEATPTRSVEQSFDPEFVPCEDDRVRVDDVDAHVLDFSVPSGSFGDDPVYLRTSPESRPDQPLFYTTVDTDDGIRIVVWSWGRIETDSLEFTISPTRALDESPYAPTLAEATARVDVGLIGGKTKRQFEDARNKLKGAAYHHRLEPFDPGAYESTLDRLQQVREGLDNARETLVEDLTHRSGTVLQDLYAENMYTVDLSVLDAECPYCGRPVHVQTATDVYERVTRSMGVCPFHIYIFDAPFDGGRPSYPRIDLGDSPVTYGERREFEISFSNPHDRRIGATFGPRTISPENEDDVFTPTREAVTIPADESRTVSFTLDAAELDPEEGLGNRWFEGVVVTDDLQVYSGMRTHFFTTGAAPPTGQ